MKKASIILHSTLLILSLACMQAVFVHAGESPGPAPNSGDGVPDGSGFDQDEWINYGVVYVAVVLIGFAFLIAILRKGNHMRAHNVELRPSYTS